MTNQTRVKCDAAAASGYFWKTITKRRRRHDLGSVNALIRQRYSNWRKTTTDLPLKYAIERANYLKLCAGQ